MAVSAGVPLGPYRLGRRLAVGGMAEIFLARRGDGAGPELVVKRILPHLAQDPQFSQMFFEEARIVSHLDHPNIVRFYDFAEADGSFYMAMELVRGVDLGDAIARASRQRAMRGHDFALDPGLVASILSGVCAGLAHAHALVVDGQAVGLVHRDITPANVLLGFGGAVKVADFGVAKLARGSRRDATRVGRVRGKYAYLSPEQSRGERLDARSDLFNVGILIFEACLGEDLYPHDDKDKARLLAAAGRIPNPERIGRLPPRLAEITRWALAPRRKERAASAAELGEALASYAREARAPTGGEAIGAAIRALFPDRLADDARSPQAAGTGPFAALATAPLTDPVVAKPVTPTLGVPVAPAPAPRPPPPPPPLFTPSAAPKGPELPPDTAAPTMLTARRVSRRRPPHRGRKRVAALAALLLATFATSAYLLTRSDGPPSEPPRALPPPPRPASAARPAPTPVELRLRGEPAGLVLRLDGRELGPAPQLATASPDEAHRVEALRDGVVVAHEEVSAGPGDVREIVLRAPPAEANVNVVSTPPDAEARVDGRELGRTPLTLTLTPGSHALSLRAEGYAPLNTTLDVEAGQDGTLAFALARDAASLRRERLRQGRLSVSLRRRRGRRRLRDARVSVDGGEPQRLPIRSLYLAPGRHQLTLEARGRSPRQRSVTIRRRRHTRVRL